MTDDIRIHLQRPKHVRPQEWAFIREDVTELVMELLEDRAIGYSYQNGNLLDEGAEIESA